MCTSKQEYYISIAFWLIQFSLKAIAGILLLESDSIYRIKTVPYSNSNTTRDQTSCNAYRYLQLDSY